MAKIEALLIRVDAESSGLNRELARSQKAARDFSRRASGDFKRFGENAKKQLSALKVAGAAAFSALAYGAGRAAVNVTKQADELIKQARAAGLSGEEFQVLKHQFELAGIQGRLAGRVTGQLATQLVNLERNSVTAVDAFGRLGLTLDDVKRGNPRLIDTFHQVVGRLRETKSDVDRLAVSLLLFGRAGREMGTFIETTSDQLGEQERQLRAVGGVIGDHLLPSAEALVDMWTVLGTALRASFTSGLLKGHQLNGVLAEQETRLRELTGAAEGVGSAFSVMATRALDMAGALRTGLENWSELSQSVRQFDLGGWYADLNDDFADYLTNTAQLLINDLQRASVALVGTRTGLDDTVLAELNETRAELLALRRGKPDAAREPSAPSPAPLAGDGSSRYDVPGAALEVPTVNVVVSPHDFGPQNDIAASLLAGIESAARSAPAMMQLGLTPVPEDAMNELRQSLSDLGDDMFEAEKAEIEDRRQKLAAYLATPTDLEFRIEGLSQAYVSQLAHGFAGGINAAIHSGEWNWSLLWKPLVDTVTGAFTNTLAEIGTDFLDRTIGDWLRNSLSDVFEQAGSGKSRIRGEGGLSFSAPTATEAVEPATTAIADGFKESSKGLGDVLGEASSSLVSGVKGILSGIGNVFSSGLGGLGGLFAGVFHDGGIVPGRAGSEVPILARAGEVVLNAAQQRELAGKLESTGPAVNLTIEQTNVGDVRDYMRRAVRDDAENLAVLFSDIMQGYNR